MRGQVGEGVTPTSALENALAPSKSRKHSNAPNGNTTSNVVPVYHKMSSAYRGILKRSTHKSENKEVHPGQQREREVYHQKVKRRGIIGPAGHGSEVSLYPRPWA